MLITGLIAKFNKNILALCRVGDKPELDIIAS